MDPVDLFNRFSRYEPTLACAMDMDWVRVVARDLAQTIDKVARDSREKSLAITALEEAVFWANAAIARQS